MSVLLHRARLLVAALEMGDVDVARRVAALHERDLRRALEPAHAADDLQALFAAAEPETAVQTAPAGASVPTFTIAVAGALEGRPVIGVSVIAGTAEDERRVWRYVLDHPAVGRPLRELLSTVDMVSMDGQDAAAELVEHMRDASA